VHDAICTSPGSSALLTAPDKAKQAGSPKVGEATVERQYFSDFIAQPPEQKAGTVFTVANLLRPYTPPDIAEVVCAAEPNFSLAEIDRAKLICLSVPQTYQVERKYLNLLCKQLFFLHAFRRFDLEAAELHRRNVIGLVLDDGQKTTLVSEDGFADHATVDELREAGVFLISATQTPLSFYASFATELKADGFMANHRRRSIFARQTKRARRSFLEKWAGAKSANISGGVTAGQPMSNWQLSDEP